MEDKKRAYYQMIHDSNKENKLEVLTPEQEKEYRAFLKEIFDKNIKSIRNKQEEYNNR